MSCKLSRVLLANAMTLALLGLDGKLSEVFEHKSGMLVCSAERTWRFLQ